MTIVCRVLMIEDDSQIADLTARYDGDEELPFWGTATAWVGMGL